MKSGKIRTHMMVDVEMAIYLYNSMVQSQKKHHEIVVMKNKYYERTRRSIVSELRLMVDLNDCNVYHSVLTMYMKFHTLRDFVMEVFSRENMLPRKVVSMAWNSGNTHVIRACLELGGDLDPQINISGSIRSDENILWACASSRGLPWACP